jgi:hypothetical protein
MDFIGWYEAHFVALTDEVEQAGLIGDLAKCALVTAYRIT